MNQAITPRMSPAQRVLLQRMRQGYYLDEDDMTWRERQILKGLTRRGLVARHIDERGCAFYAPTTAIGAAR